MKMISGSFVCFMACAFLTGCGRAPAVNIIGSFLPAWMICLTAGIILAFVARSILVRYRLETEVGPLALFYPCAVTLMTCLLWLIFFQ
jgi:YtcA family